MHHTGLPYSETPERIVTTHCSIALLYPNRVVKLKKNIKFPFLDYSTLELRREFCQAEVDLNRRFTPEIYTGVCGVFEREGKLVFGDVVENVSEAGSDPVDYGVVMQRIPDGRWMSDLIKAGTLNESDLDALLVDLVASWNKIEDTKEVRKNGLPENLRFNTVANIGECERFAPDLLSREAWERLDALLRGWFDDNHAVFEQRVEQGHIRDGHGDLKPSNIAFLENGPVVTDSIEFNPLFRRLDTLCEVSFLATGLESLGRFDLAARVFAAYREASGDEYPEMLRRYYQAHLACVMGKVTALQLDNPELKADARAEINALASHCFALGDFHARESHVVVVHGVIGSGKSTLATAIGERLGWPVFNSDAIRKQESGVAPTDRLPDSAYSPEISAQVYQRLSEEAKSNRTGVVLDAQYTRAKDRQALYDAVGPCLWVRCDADRDELERRLTERQARNDNVSDAGPELLDTMLDRFDTDHNDGWGTLIRARDDTDALLTSLQRELLGEAFNPAMTRSA